MEILFNFKMKYIEERSSVINPIEDYKLLLESKMKCKYCRESVFLLYKEVRDPKQWTLDRIDNNFGHNNSFPL